MGGGQPAGRSVSGGRSHAESINAHGVVHVSAAGHVDTGNSG